MVRFAVLFGFLLCSFSVTAQENCNDYDFYNQFLRVRVDVGSFMPLGNLRNSIGESPHVGFYFGYDVNGKYSLDAGGSLFIPVNRKELEYYLADTTLTGNASLSGTMGFWVNRSVKLKQCWLFDSRIGTGVGFLQTNIPTNNPEDENNDYFGSETVFISFGTGVRKVILYSKSIGLSVNYFFVPYNAFSKHLSANFGNQYLTFSTCFTF